MTYQVGDMVKIKRNTLPDWLQVFPVGTVVSVKDKNTLIVELLFVEEQIEVKVRDVEIKKS